MPRAFLIKKKRHYGLSSTSSPANVKKKCSSLVATEFTQDEELCNSREKDYENASESGRSSVSGQVPSPASSPNAIVAAVPDTAFEAFSSVGEAYGRSSVLEPLNLNASAAAAAAAVPWMKSFLTPYLPFNFPHPLQYPHPSYHPDAPYPAHFLPASPPSSHHVLHSHQALSVPRGALYPSRSEPPSPSCPCPLSPDTPPRDGTPTEKEHPKLGEELLNGKRALQFTATPAIATSAGKLPTGYADGTYPGQNSLTTRVDSRYSPTFWTDSDRCSSNGSIHSDGRDGEERMIIITREDSPKNLAVNGGSRRRSQDGGPRYQCPDCNKSYSTFSGLSKHQQFHCSTTNKKSFSCKYCEKVYMSLGALKMHIRTHTLPCKCKLCGKAFSRPWLLQGHIRTHTGEKPFACPHCNRAFADRSNLRAHLQTHSDVKKYSCKTCAKTFSRMSLLLKHTDGGCAAANVTAITTTLTQERLGP